MIKKWRLFQRNNDGAAAIEFALVAPTIILFVVGIIEVTTAMAVSTMLEGGLREASRFGVTGGGNNRAARITEIIGEHTYGLIDPNSINLSTRVYGTFGSIGDEEYTDTNNNGVRDNNEPYTDRNGNGNWDADGGTNGVGNSNQIVVYRVSYDWPYLTGMLRPVLGDHLRLTSAIAVRNEPF